jgi:FkbM family methyltransferase
LENRVRCENMALSSKTGTATLFLPASDTRDQETTGTLVSDSWQHRNGSQPFEIDAVRFDDYESRSPTRVDLIKIDVEDFEADVLEGMQQTISATGLSSSARSFPACIETSEPARSSRL